MERGGPNLRAYTVVIRVNGHAVVPGPITKTLVYTRALLWGVELATTVGGAGGAGYKLC